MKRRNTILSFSLIALAAAGISLSAYGEEAGQGAGHDPAEKYSGFAEKNPDVVGDRGNGLPPETERAEEAAAEVQRYPEGMAEGNPSLQPGAPETERPYSEEADVHGDFGEGNPDVQR